MGAVPGKKGIVFITARTSLPFTAEDTSADADFLIYTIDDRDLRYWDRDEDIDVFRNASLVDAEEYRIQHAGGKVHFFVAQDPGDVITVSGNYFPVSEAAAFNEFTLTINSEIVDVSHFTDELDPHRGYRRTLANIVDASGTVSGFHIDDHNFAERLIEQERLAIEFEPWPGTGEEFFGVFAFMDSNEITQAVEGAIETSVSFASDGDILVDTRP